ncbi:MAG: indolepyruvate ferredoxin oxidoreductase family protein [Pseudomonadota bacterium]|nr:indolepyruvate ferredoxin oxidoreductase family protein [Pseudomonadota bacterium]
MTHATPHLLRNIQLNDKFAPGPTRVYLTGIDALVRLPLLQHEIDTAAGLKTGGFISGYRGSPLGGLDQSLWAAKKYLESHHITFNPGINEELAATSVWGSQQLGIVSDSNYDGVFGMWYGKGPGVDRSMDVIKHANAFGTSPYGGVLAVAGDDHACKSSTLPHQSEHMFMGASVPVLAPSNVQEVLDFGIYGWAMSRFSGCWVALKAITDNMDAAMGVEIDPARYSITLPPKEAISPDGMHARWPDPPLDQEKRLNLYKIYAARLFASINGLNRIVMDSVKPALGIITSGKAYLDVMEALGSLGIDDQTANDLGIRVLKIGMPWPLDPEIIQVFSRGLTEILVVEEKRSVIEDQLTSQLYNLAGESRPKIYGEFDHRGESLLPNTGELDPDLVGRAIIARLEALGISLRAKTSVAVATQGLCIDTPTRTPHFCSGCPHNTSTKVPKGSVAMGGIGCHYMATWMPDRDTRTFTQMGGEGAAWIGQAAFSSRKHVFQNLGDGTYFHSGSLAIRAAVASKVNITYKILFNEAVAMTGGQAIDGSLSLDDLLHQIRAEGVKHIAVVSEDVAPRDLPSFVEAWQRADYDELQRRYAQIEGTSVIVYQQLCATEKRRRQKRQLMPPAKTKVFIHPELCEGCGDCGHQSNCLSIQPKETELGTKRVIDQHSCNTDLSCVEGFCPSFITLPATALDASEDSSEIPVPIFDPLPDPSVVALDKPWCGLVAGIGGTGVLTVNSLLAMAAHIEGKGFATMNQTGLAQKYGSVVSHIKIARDQSDIHAVRVKDAQANLLLGCDALVASNPETLRKLSPSCHAIVNTQTTETRDFLYTAEATTSTEETAQLIRRIVGEHQIDALDASMLAIALTGDAIAANLFLVGLASQRGLLPISPKAIERAIEVNGVAVELNQSAFTWGRRFVEQQEKVLALLPKSTSTQLTSLDDIVADREARLVCYQSEGYAALYVRRIRTLEKHLNHLPDNAALLCEIARQLYRLMALKDEYEVARILTTDDKPDGMPDLNRAGVNFYFAPPLLSQWESRDGRPKKIRMGAWARFPLRVLAGLKFVRGTAMDVFAYTSERRAERADLADYLADIDLIAEMATVESIDSAQQLANAPSKLKGYGHVRSRSRRTWLEQRNRCRAELQLVQPLNVTDVNHRGINEH